MVNSQDMLEIWNDLGLEISGLFCSSNEKKENLFSELELIPMHKNRIL